MSIGSIVGRLAGAVKNGVVWGGTWFALAFVTIIGLRTVGVVVPAEIGVLDAIGMAIRVGIAGGVTGGAFALFVSHFYRGRRLSEINWVRFGLGGAVVSELVMIAFFAVTSLGNGFPALGDVLSDLVIAAGFGGIAAGASMWLAQRAETGSIVGPDRRAGLHAGSAPLGAAGLAQRTHARARRQDRAASQADPT